MKKCRIIFLLMLILFLTSCKFCEGNGFAALNKLDEYGFYDILVPINVTQESHIINDTNIVNKAIMSFDDFQEYAFNLYQHYAHKEDIVVLGIVNRTSSVGLFTTYYLTLTEELELKSYENIENTSVRYMIVFSTESFDDKGDLPSSRSIALEYSPQYSTSGPNVKITFNKFVPKVKMESSN